jgi:ssDNA-binding Zn-finger/Zn-ribbon topoisomerase 1
MKCTACGHFGNDFITLDIVYSLVSRVKGKIDYEEYDFSTMDDSASIYAENKDYRDKATIYACPYCGTLKLNLKEIKI